MTNGRRSSVIPSRAERFVVRRWSAGEASRGRISAAELLFIASSVSVIVMGWVALVLAQLGLLSRTTLLLTLSLLIIGTIAAVTRQVPKFEIRNSKSEIRNLALAGILLVAAILYTPPADYAPAFLDAGWYANTGALIARTGQLTARPAVLEDLPAVDRHLFVRTYQDLRASLPQFPDRHDLGFYNLTFAIDLGRNGPVAPYHPPFASVWIAILRLVGGPGLGAYAAPLFGLLFVLAVYAAGCVIFGPNVGLVGALLTAVSPPVVYYARTPFAELLAGALIWAGVYAISRFAVTTAKPARSPLLLCSPAPLLLRSSAPLLPCSPAPLLLLAGLAFGTALLAKIESILLLFPIALFWLIWLRRRWATHHELVAFLAPFGILLAHASLLNVTVLRPYVTLNAYGIWSMLVAVLSRPAMWATVAVLYLGGIITLLVIRHTQILEIGAWRLGTRYQSPISNLQYLISNLQAATSFVILFAAGIALLLAWPATRADSPSTWSSLVTLSLFLTPLGLCLGIVGLSTLVADDLSRRTAFLVMLLGTAGLATVMMPAISANVSYLYTIRRQLPIVVPALLLLTGYVTLRWAGLAEGGSHHSRQPAGLRRGLVILILAFLILNFLDTGRPLVRHRELAGSSTFIAKLARSFESDDIVLFESVDRGAHVGRFAAPLWAEHGISALLLSSTYPPQDRLVNVIRRWQDQGRRVYFVSQSHPPPFTLSDLPWELVDRRHWAGSAIAAKMSFPPETWTVQVPFYIYEAKSKR